MDALFSAATAAYIVRWAHVIFGVIWLGHLYFFNLVNVPFQGDLDKDLKAKINPKLFGWHYLGPEHLMSGPDGKMSGRAMWIEYGMLLGLIMWFNVWFVIWPRQRKILGGLASGTPHPDAPKLAATAGKASRFNTFASGPLLFAMLGAPHFGVMSGPVLIAVTVLGVGFWFGMIKRSFKVRTDAA